MKDVTLGNAHGRRQAGAMIPRKRKVTIIWIN